MKRKSHNKITPKASYILEVMGIFLLRNSQSLLIDHD